MAAPTLMSDMASPMVMDPHPSQQYARSPQSCPEWYPRVSLILSAFEACFTLLTSVPVCTLLAIKSKLWSMPK